MKCNLVALNWKKIDLILKNIWWKCFDYGQKVYALNKNKSVAEKFNKIEDNWPREMNDGLESEKWLKMM